MTTDLNDQQIKELLEGITQGEWRHEYSAQRGNTVWAQITSTGSMQIAETNFAEFDAQNAKFIAAAPALVAQLQRQLAAAQARIQELEEQREAEAMDAWGDNFDRGL